MHDGEVFELPRDLEEVGRAEALQPQRRPLIRAAAREEERALGILAEPRGEEARAREVREEK